MTVELRPETEQLLLDAVERGHYSSVDDFITCALSVMGAQDLPRNPAAVIARILNLSGTSQPDPDGLTAVDYVRQDRDR